MQTDNLSRLELKAVSSAAEAKLALYEGVQALRAAIGGLRRAERGQPQSGKLTFTGIKKVKK